MTWMAFTVCCEQQARRVHGRAKAVNTLRIDYEKFATDYYERRRSALDEMQRLKEDICTAGNKLQKLTQVNDTFGMFINGNVAGTT